MTSYTAIADTEIDAESPVTEELMTRLRDNPIAIGEGATGAPRIRGAGIARPQDLPTLTVTAADTVEVSSSCDVTAGTTSTSSTSDVVARTWVLQSVTGTVRLKATLVASGISGANAKAFKNGVQQGSTQTTDTTPLDVSWDISAVPTDTIELKHDSATGAAISTVSGMGLYANNGYVVRSPYVEYAEQDTV